MHLQLENNLPSSNCQPDGAFSAVRVSVGCHLGGETIRREKWLVVAPKWNYRGDVVDLVPIPDVVRNPGVNGILSSENAVETSTGTHHDFESFELVLVDMGVVR